ncbi:MAG: hypothetical protein QHC67_10340 [Sphingobium sp.]|uniref:hypothetical protein n=1 Tax=Sphingobium sp. TaxID=1912891 RepID=UPI0029AF1014|nr:hypothetical protein [Sphingobium sp.]MDX3910203.1 hypothetical protein [Sphingobium sp.]
MPALDFQCRADLVAAAKKHVFAVRAALDPQVMLRVAGLFAQRNIIPDQICARQSGEVLLIDIEVQLENGAVARLLVEKLRAIVRGVR